MRKGFTMMELVFVIVILGILAVVAIPRLAATRDDAKLATVKTDIGVFLRAVPAWYQGQKDARIDQAANFDTKKWIKSTNANDEAYTLSLDGQECVTISIWDMNTTAGAVATLSDTAQLGTDINITDGHWSGSADFSPVFRVIKGSNDPTTGYSSTSICDRLWNEMKVTEANITMGAKKVN